MCICCCPSRKALLIYSILITIVAIIYGIVAMSLFASKTDLYKLLEAKIDQYDKSKNSRLLLDINDIYRNPEKFAFDAIDYISAVRIANLGPQDFENHPYSLIKMLKGIENGVGSLLFVFPVLFLAAEIAYLVFACGISENQLMRVKTYTILNTFKIITYTFSIILIFLAIFYGGILLAIYIEYERLIVNIDRCSRRILIGMALGYYSFWYYITLATIFGRERTLFKLVGTVEAPGARAEFDIDGNPIVRTIVSPVVALNQKVIVQTVNVPYQQVVASNPQQNNNQVLQKYPESSQKGEPVENISSARMMNNEKK